MQNILKLMELSPKAYSRIKSSYPYITFALLFSMLIFEAYPVPVSFERGIEIVRSRGYELTGVNGLSPVEANLKTSEIPMREFLLLCEALRSEGEAVRVFSDIDTKVLFLVSPDSEEGQLIICRFR
jgi:hypothetical protein